MHYLVDSDVFLHVLLHTDRSEEAREFLDKYSNDIGTTVLNIMEIGSVLSRKYRWRKRDINKVIDVIKKTLTILIPTEYDMLDAMELSLKHYLSPIDALMLVISKNKGLILVTFDGELLKYKEKSFAVQTPSKR